MAKIDNETLKAIDEYYTSKISNICNHKQKIEEDIQKWFANKFEDDKDVLTIKKLFKKLEERYGSKNLTLECSLYSFYNFKSYENDEEWIECNTLISKLRNERALLITQLECNPKNSAEYKEAYKKLQELFK